jgi:hypothetical protein
MVIKPAEYIHTLQVTKSETQDQAQASSSSSKKESKDNEIKRLELNIREGNR